MEYISIGLAQELATLRAENDELKDKIAQFEGLHASERLQLMHFIGMIALRYGSNRLEFTIDEWNRASLMTLVREETWDSRKVIFKLCP